VQSTRLAELVVERRKWRSSLEKGLRVPIFRLHRRTEREVGNSLLVIVQAR
jgi:hypothetical protein